MFGQTATFNVGWLALEITIMALPTRRRFLNSSLGFAAALSSGAVALAAEGPTTATSGPTTKPRNPTTRPAGADSLSGANARINIAVIGCGDRGQFHITELLSLSDHVNIVALCDPDQARVAEKAQFIDGETGAAPRTYTDVRKMLENKEIDAVTIATPNHWHTLASIWSVQAGKDVFVEKPLSHTIVEGRRLIEYARKYNKIVQHGTQSRSMMAMNRAMQFIHSGGLGRVFLARGTCYKARPSIGHVASNQPVPSSVDYDLWCGPAPKAPPRRAKFHYDWHWFWDIGNGDIGNQGVHQIDICMWGLNKREFAPRIQSIGGRFGYDDDGQTPNTQLAVFDYDDGAKIIFEVRGLPTKPLRGAAKGVCNVFYGTEGSLVVDTYESCSAYAPNGEPIEMPEYTRDNATNNHFVTFIKAIRSRALGYHQGDAETGHIASGMCHLANISYKLGKKVPFNARTKAFGDDRAAYATLARMEKHLTGNGLNLEETQYVLGRALTFDPTTEKFVGNDLANGLLTRDYRGEYKLPKAV